MVKTLLLTYTGVRWGVSRGISKLSLSSSSFADNGTALDSSKVGYAYLLP